MYQFYYANTKLNIPHKDCKLNVADKFTVTAVRPTMWEEHCLECSAPLCFNNCVHYIPRSDGRCKRFDNGIFVYPEPKACCGQAAHIKFRKWANMMTVIFPSMISFEQYNILKEKNQKLGDGLKSIAESRLPQKVRWETIRTREWLRRRSLRKASTDNTSPDAFIFHGYSYSDSVYRLIVEVYDDHNPVFKTSLTMNQGENLYILNKSELTSVCNKPDYLVKIYPENDYEAELDILWCDFVQGKEVISDTPASKVKCVVWDLDNTLWNGILIETDDPSKLKLNEGVLETIKALDQRGIVQSIASKNDFDSAWTVIEQMGLSEYFLYPQIHWNAKSGSIKQIAKDINIGVDTFVLIDDSVFERNQVKSELPSVRVYDVTELPDLLKKDEFQVQITQESKNRRKMYQAEAKRKTLMQSDNDDTITFLKKCNLCLTLFEPKTDDEISRCYELIARTNQLNMSGKKYTQDEFKSVFEREGYKNISFECKDDFGSYGIVAFAQYKVEDKSVVFSEFAMSCRVAGKYVESAFFAKILDNENCNTGIFGVLKTKKNILLRNTLSDIGFKIDKEDNGSIDYTFDKELKHKDIISVSERG